MIRDYCGRNGVTIHELVDVKRERVVQGGRMTSKTITNSHGVRENHGRGKVEDFLTEKYLMVFSGQHSIIFVLLKGAL